MSSELSEAAIGTFIEALMSRPEAHARFANTLALLEYMGARKILKSQQADTLSLSLVSHAAEELRHAQLLKRLALRLSDGGLATWSEAQLLCGPEARAWLQGVDRACARALAAAGSGRADGRPDAGLNHALTTLLIEERATVIYPVYAAVLTRHGVPHALRGLLLEEDRHLAGIRTQVAAAAPLSEAQLAALRTEEARRFDAWLAACGRALSGQVAA